MDRTLTPVVLRWCAGLAAVIVAGGFGWIVSERAHTSAVKNTELQIASLLKRVDAAEVRDRTRESILHAFAASPPPPVLQEKAIVPGPVVADLQQDLSADGDTPVVVDRKHAMEARHRAALQILAETLSHDTIDPDATKAAATLRSIGQAAEFDGVDVDIDCRQTICGVKLHSSTPDRTRQAMQLIATKLPWSGSGRSYFDFATGEGTLYVSREGVALPSLSPTEAQ
jgi:hypothetical protein